MREKNGPYSSIEDFCKRIFRKKLLKLPGEERCPVSGVMNFTPTFGWYYIDSNQKAPAWTGVPYFYNFLTRQGRSVGPMGRDSTMEEIRPGDIIQLSFSGEAFQHSPVVVSVGDPITPENILVAAHSYDADNRPLATYEYRDIRFIHIEGTMLP